MHFDVFNGDADGLCALNQLRLAQPAASTLVTGVKRDITLLERVCAQAGDDVLVLDIALKQNRKGLDALLQSGARVRYFDHHVPGDIPDHPNLETHIDIRPDVCTSLLVNAYLGGRYLAWAVVAAFGDNLRDTALQAAQPLHLSSDALATLERLGEYINYNAYGESVEDLLYPPETLYRLINRYPDPLDFVAEEAAFARLAQGMAGDLAAARALLPEEAREGGAIYVLPDAGWSRRVVGTFANELARAEPYRAHAILTRHAAGGFVVSVRAPWATKLGAEEVCRQFASGGGRAAAAGINDLPEAEVARFMAAFHQRFPRAAG
ncbi:MAG: acetyltransferase [Betaproteobacteria bacterium]|nr:acetyltransferase [Betaproteobacteria bacterium]